MVATSFWYVSMAPPQAIPAAQAAAGRQVARAEADTAFVEALQEWRLTPSVVHGPAAGSPGLTPTSESFLRGFRSTELPEDQLVALSVAETEPGTWDLSGDRPASCEAFFIAVRGVPAVSLLYVGLGPQRSGRLPGSFGFFALDAAETAAAGDAIRHAHMLSPADRAGAIERMHDWLHVGQDPACPVDHLLEALPEVIGTAAARGAGIIGLAGSTG